MTSLATLILVILLIILLGVLILFVPILGFYWGPTGKPLAGQAERKRLREEELRLRAEQIERSKKNPTVTRNPSFWDNRKVYK
jgi:hypothetical protein